MKDLDMNYLRTAIVGASTLLLLACEPAPESATSTAVAEQPAAVEPMSQESNDGAAMSGVLAMVNGVPVTEKALQRFTAQQKSKVTDPQILLNQLVALEILSQEAVTNGLDQHTDVKDALEFQKRAVLASMMMRTYMSTEKVSEEEVRAAYDAKAATAGQEYNARHILLETEVQATEVIGLLDSGSDFSELAKEKSTGPSGAAGGTLGWFANGQMVAPFYEATKAMEKGSYSKTPVNTEFGWHVIMLDDVRDTTLPEFDQVKARLVDSMMQMKMEQYVQAMRATAEVEFTQ
ncbi:MAG TPA: peptidylprolyl isomerase [Alphaproteobacteria bacterium]|nr:peptidylprolyl isomerase [Alphaproteobacteria bacterium]